MYMIIGGERIGLTITQYNFLKLEKEIFAQQNSLNKSTVWILLTEISIEFQIDWTNQLANAYAY